MPKITVEISHGHLAERKIITKTIVRAVVPPEGETMILDSFRVKASKVEHDMNNPDGDARVIAFVSEDTLLDIEKQAGWTRVR